MTNEEAKEAIKEAYGNSKYTDGIIKALELRQEWGELHDHMVKETIKLCKSGTISMLVADCLIRLPSVTPQRPKGKWIDRSCSICGYGVAPWNKTPYCPNCGAKMEVEKV